MTIGGTPVGIGVDVVVGVAVGAFVGTPVGVIVGVSVGSFVGVGVGVIVGVGVSVGVAVGSKVGVGVGVGVMVGVEQPDVSGHAGVGVIAGSGVDKLFWGSDAVRIIKSLELSFVSSPLPLNSSVPPELIEVKLELLFALRSTLPLFGGLPIVADSEAIADPRPTKSITLMWSGS